jgi:FixJ family two-component response regulator
MPHVPDIALLDIVLPGVSGVQYAGDLRRLFPDLRLLFMTGWGENYRHFHEDAQRLGRILYKPFDRQTLIDAIRGVD